MQRSACDGTTQGLRIAYPRQRYLKLIELGSNGREQYISMPQDSMAGDCAMKRLIERCLLAISI